MSKALQHLIFLISILYIVSFEPKFMERDETFKPFVSVPSISTLQKVVNNVKVDEENEPASFSLQDGIPESQQVKCLFLKDYNVYDISHLGANTFKSIGERGHEYNFENFNNSKYTIIFNFCYNLKQSSRCEHGDDKQAFYLVNDDNCQPLSGDIKDGNNWITIKNETTGEVEYIEIEVNRYDDAHSLKYRLICNKDMDKKEFNVVEGTTSITKNDKGGFDVTLVIESKEACVKVDFYFIFKFIQDYKVLFIILLMAFGLFNCILGKKYAKHTAFLLCVFIVTILVLVFSQYVLPSGCAEWIIWVMFAVGIILGCTAGYFTFKYEKYVLALVIGGVSGFFIGQFLYNLFGNQIPLKVNGIVINIIFVVISIVVMIIIAKIEFFHKFIVIFATSFIGAYCFIRGISLFGGGFPDEITIMDLRGKGETEQLSELLTWKVYVYLAAMVITTVLAIIAQYKFFKEKDDDNEEKSDGKDKNLVKSSE